MTDEECLARCQALARMAADRQESPVGSVIVVAGTIIGEGIEAAREKRDITAHAEVEAVRAAIGTHGTDLSLATLYTTHEPCLLCSYVIRHHHIARVVIQHAVAHVGGVTSTYPILTAKDVQVWGAPPLVTWVS